MNRRVNFIIKKKRFSVSGIHLPKMPAARMALAFVIVIALLVATNVRFQELKAVVLPDSAAEFVSSKAGEANAVDQSKLAKQIEAKNIPGVESLEADEGNTGVKVTLNSDTFFQIGTAFFDSSKEPMLKEIAEVLKTFSAKASIEIEGHTDNSPVVRMRKIYRSNWELSLARAASMVHIFEDAGFDKEKLKVSGYGDSRPVSTDAMKNRRIILHVYQQVEGANPQTL